MTLVIGFEGWIWVLIASVPGLCILFTFKFLSKDASLVMRPRYEKTGVLHMPKQRHRSAYRSYRKANQRLFCHYTDSTVKQFYPCSDNKDAD